MAVRFSAKLQPGTENGGCSLTDRCHGHVHGHGRHAATIAALPALLVRVTKGELPLDLDREIEGGSGEGRGVPPDLDRETGVEVYR